MPGWQGEGPGAGVHSLCVALGPRVASLELLSGIQPENFFWKHVGIRDAANSAHQTGKENGGARSKRALEEEEGTTDVLSKNKQKKKLRNPHKTFDPLLKRKWLQPLESREKASP